MQHLDDDLLAGVQPRAMDLPDRGRGHRPRLELGEKLFDRPAEFALDDRCGPTSGRIGGDVVLELLELSASRTPTRSGRVLRSWPSLMKVGPSSARASRRRVSQGCRAMAVPAAGLEQVLGEIRPQPADPGRQPVLAQHRQDLPPPREFR